MNCHSVMQKFIQALLILVLTSCLLKLCASQVTLSKGWGPGKRFALRDEQQCILNRKSALTACNLLMVGLKPRISCESPMAVHSAREENENNLGKRNIFTQYR